MIVWCACLFLQKVLFSLGGSFLYYADRFKIYSAFCASHTKVPKVLAKGKNIHRFLPHVNMQSPLTIFKSKSLRYFVPYTK